MLKNITLSAEEALIENVRCIAKNENTTLNALFRDWLEQYQARENSSLVYKDIMKRFGYAKSGRKFSREELNAR